MLTYFNIKRTVVDSMFAGATSLAPTFPKRSFNAFSASIASPKQSSNNLDSMVSQTELSTALNMDTEDAIDDFSEIVTADSDALETMQRWKEEIVYPLCGSIFDEKIAIFLQESNVKTVQDIKNKYTDDKWVDSLGNCGAMETALFRKLRRVLYTYTDSLIVSADYEIANSALSHTADLDSLLQRVEDTFMWYSDWQYPKKFVGPYFPMIQSSGMGKTKLLY
jgi:hypothetical protein